MRQAIIPTRWKRRTTRLDAISSRQQRLELQFLLRHPMIAPRRLTWSKVSLFFAALSVAAFIAACCAISWIDVHHSAGEMALLSLRLLEGAIPLSLISCGLMIGAAIYDAKSESHVFSASVLAVLVSFSGVPISIVFLVRSVSSLQSP
jgi:hypothetical protein